jgi:hypothetical protein
MPYYDENNELSPETEGKALVDAIRDAEEKAEGGTSQKKLDKMLEELKQAEIDYTTALMDYELAESEDILAGAWSRAFHQRVLFVLCDVSPAADKAAFVLDAKLPGLGVIEEEQVLVHIHACCLAVLQHDPPRRDIPAGIAFHIPRIDPAVRLSRTLEDPPERDMPVCGRLFRDPQILRAVRIGEESPRRLNAAVFFCG